MTQKIDEKINTFFRQFPVQEFQKNETIARAGSLADHFFWIESGAVKMMTTSGHGQNLVLHIFHPGACFPLLALINEGKNGYDLIALIPTKVRKVPQPQFVTFLKENSDILFEFQLRTLNGLQGLLHRIEQSTFVPAYNQVASLLLYFGKHFAETESSDLSSDSSTSNSLPTSQTIELRITHQEIAEWLGLSRENVSIQMKQLERDGLIRKNGQFLEIIDGKKLARLADASA